MAEPRTPPDTDLKLPPEIVAKLEAIRKAASYSLAPAPKIEDMLAEIELGHLSQKIENQ